MAQRLQFLFRLRIPTTLTPGTSMARHIHTARLQEGIPARAPAFRTPASNVPPDAATNRRFPRAPGTRTDHEVVTPVLAPCVHIRDVPLRWYGIGGTG
jgi:hypothetical protein